MPALVRSLALVRPPARAGVALALMLAGCRPASVEPATDPPATATAPAERETETETETETDQAQQAMIEQATRGVEDPQLAALLADHWLARVEVDPYYSGAGWGELGPEGRAARRARRAQWLSRARAIELAGLDEDDRISLELLRAGLEADEAGEVCEYWAWAISTRDNPLETLHAAVDTTALADAAAGEKLLARLDEFDGLLQLTAADLRDGLSRGLVADARTLDRTIEMFEGQTATATEGWSAYLIVAERTADWADAAARDQLLDRLRTLIDEQLRPALVGFTAVLREELLPAARGPERVGVGALANGAACYQAMIQLHTSDAISADALHELGLAEIARIDGELLRLGRKQFAGAVKGKRDAAVLAKVLTRLRTDPSLYFADADAVEAFARESLERAQGELPKWFGHLPKSPCAVQRVPDYQAPYTYVGYYNQPSSADPSGYYFINTLAPQTRPRFQARALAAHESVPGHHLQIALSLELGELPMFRHTGGDTVFVEGWALYAERLAARGETPRAASLGLSAEGGVAETRSTLGTTSFRLLPLDENPGARRHVGFHHGLLAEEMGLYQDDLDRLGALSYDAWRAARLVVDTGLHTRGWTVEQAREFMRAHTALAEGNIVNEVDRYVGWPGQALGYKYGQLEILRLRAEAEATLGADFDIREFHDVVLGAGPVNLQILRRRVSAWIDSQRSASDSQRSTSDSQRSTSDESSEGR